MSKHESRHVKEKNLHNHLEFHDAKGWLLRGCKDEDARTIMEAVKNIPSRRLNRRLARILSY